MHYIHLNGFIAKDLIIPVPFTRIYTAACVSKRFDHGITVVMFRIPIIEVKGEKPINQLM